MVASGDAKFTQELAEVHAEFKSHISQHRGTKIDVDAMSTGVGRCGLSPWVRRVSVRSTSNSVSCVLLSPATIFVRPDDTSLTGEAWLAVQALPKGLVDALMTSDEHLHCRAQAGFQIIHVGMKQVKQPWLGLWRGLDMVSLARAMMKSAIEAPQMMLSKL